MASDPSQVVTRALEQHRETIELLGRSCHGAIVEAASIMAAALRISHRLYLFGNGGSAADAQHIAAEFVGRFETERRAHPASALTVNPSALTAIGNDYGFDRVFARQLEAFARPGDVVIGISTSGNSENVLVAMGAARRTGCRTIGLTGAGGTKLAALCDVAVMVPAIRTSRIQEAHILVGHVWCEIVDELLAESAVPGGDLSATHAPE